MLSIIYLFSYLFLHILRFIVKRNWKCILNLHYTNKCHFHCLSSFTGWDDITELPEGLENYSLTRMEVKKEFHFADEQTKSLFTNLSHAFQARNRHRDRYMDYEEEVVIDRFEDHVIAYVDPLKREWWIVSTWYWIFSVLLLSSIYRWMIVRRTCQLSVTILKQVFVRL